MAEVKLTNAAKQFGDYATLDEIIASWSWGPEIQQYLLSESAHFVSRIASIWPRTCS